jgi:hypothetical protein
MINIYAYSYPSAVNSKIETGHVLLKLGDSHRDTEVRINEQGNSAEWEEKVIIGSWTNLQKILRDHDLHEVLTKRGLWHKGKHKGTEWFKIPGNNVSEAKNYIDDLITEFEGKRIRKSVKLRGLQEQTLDRAMEIIGQCEYEASLLANLCPRFGKTIWALMLFNRLTTKYGNRVMLLPAYWLSVHSSFITELNEYNDFLDIVYIDADADNAAEQAASALEAEQRIIIPMSLHGELSAWQAKHTWISEISNNDTFVFADEGDFGTHTENQVAKLNFLFDANKEHTDNKMFVRVYASGTNVQRLAKCSHKIDGVLYTAYSQLEKSEPGMIQRRFFCTQVESLKQEVEQFDEKVQPSWNKIWAKPLANRSFVSKLIGSLIGEDSLRTELNLSNLAGEPVYCFMLLVSANNKEMSDIAKIARHNYPDYHFKVLNGDFTNNSSAQYETEREINEAKIAGKKGIVIIANQMGSRSYSVSEIQATVIAYDRGSVDATVQKVSRCLTPGVTYDNSIKENGYIVDLSFDPNRSENVERLILEEAIQIQRSQGIEFVSAVKFVLSSIDLFKVNEYGYPEEVTEEVMFGIFGDNETMLKVADIAVDVNAAIESGVFDILTAVNADGKASKQKKTVIGADAINAVTKGKGKQSKTLTDKEKRDAGKIINEAIRALNMSATSVYDLANGGESYRECLMLISQNADYDNEFTNLFGISSSDTISLVDENVLNGAILDVIVQNSKQVDTFYQ